MAHKDLQDFMLALEIEFKRAVHIHAHQINPHLLNIITG